MTQDSTTSKSSVELPIEFAGAPNSAEQHGNTPKSPKRIISLVAIILVPVIIVVLALIFWPSTPTDNTAEPSDNIDETSINWDSYNSSNITLTGDSLKITSGGVYTLSGEISDGLIEIDTEKDVKLILNGVTVTNSNGPALYVANADNVVIELATGTTNTFTDSSTYTGWDEDVNGAIFSHDDLVIQGDGALIVNGNFADGIVGKDDLKVAGGNITIDAKDDGLRGRDSVYISGGNLSITANGDAIKSSNADETDKGWILIDGGTLALAAGDDGIHAESTLQIDGGVIDITRSYEGIEGASVVINGGAISVVSSDDGLNAAGGNDSSSPNFNNYQSTDSSEYSITINGGTLSVTSQGDGIDSNGSLTFNGGTVTVDGPSNSANSALDAEGTIIYNGGEVIALGASGMAVAPNTSSTGYSLSIFFSSSNPAKTTLSVKDSAGDIVTEYTSLKVFQHASLSSAKFKEGETYTIYLNGTEYGSVTITSKTTSLGQGGMGGGVMPGEQGGMGGGMMPGEQGGERREQMR